MAEIFRELHGDYVENAGQQISLREYLDYFEPLGSALARLPDGTGGPFVHHFTDGGGRTISALGWVVSAKSKRFGGWKLWGTWTDGPMPPVAIPLFWPVLSDPARVSDWVGRANEDSDRLLDGERWTEVLSGLKTTRLRDASFREYLKAELSRAYAVPLPHRAPIEIELTPKMLDLLPWIFLLGPVDPSVARLQPNRFNGPGYQYILSDDVPDAPDTAIAAEIEKVVDAAAKSVVSGWRLARELRARRERPQTKAMRPRERNEMRSAPSAPAPSRRAVRVPWNEIAISLDAVWKIVVVVLLAWIAWNVHVIRKATSPPARAAVSPTLDVAPVYEPDLSPEGLRSIATRLASRPPRGVRVSDTLATGVTAEKLSRAAVEVFLRRNGCLETTESVDGKFSTAEERAIRNCATLQDEGLMKDRTDPDPPRAIAWLEETLR